MQTPVSRVPPDSSQRSLQTAASKPKLLDQVRIALRSRHYSKRTEQTYVQWIKRHIFFHKARHPSEMAETEVQAIFHLQFAIYHLSLKRISTK